MVNKELIKQIIVSNQENIGLFDLIERETELPIDSGKIITVPGVRRCGKSSLLMLAIKKLLAKGIETKRILLFNFDDERLKFDNTNLESIISAYRELYVDVNLRDIYIFFDEIQIVDGWQSFVRRIYEQDCPNIFLTGSNSKMLSSELASSLRGRSLQYDEYPLSFREMCLFRGVSTNIYSPKAQASLSNLFDEYMIYGGFPEVVMAKDVLKDRILTDYFYVMLYRDLVEHFNINPITTARYFIQRVMENLTKPTSINKIFNEMKSLGISIGKDKVYSLADQCESIYFFIPLHCYTNSVQRSLSSEKKFYCIDVGLRKQILRPQSDDKGKILENIVFLELYRNLSQSENLSYYKGHTECDFVLSEMGQVNKLIQVCWDVSDQSTLDREVNGLVEASKNTSCDQMYIITHDIENEISTQTGAIHIIPAWKWCLI